ncbi:MAG TPA: ribonucleoside-triphosphate reductase [Candidatus Atribacteria bacterium]|nr:ribonucleoside-triphosphate reductase [Candidatus Atribacteria bacterium]
MSLKEKIIEVSKNFPAEFKEQRDGSLALQFVIAERKVFLSKKKLTYKCRVRINDEEREVTFFEMLGESNVGLSVGSGFEFKKETYGIKGKEREGRIEEMSKLFGKNYKYSFDYKKIREAIKKVTQDADYSFSVKFK